MPQLQVPPVEPADALSNLERSESSVSPAVLDRAKALSDALHRLGAPTPFIGPTEFGGIQFEWRGGRFELDLEILPETETVCVTFQDGEIHKKGEVRNEKELQMLIAWLHQGALNNDEGRR
jgi:hypothetical protein